MPSPGNCGRSSASRVRAIPSGRYVQRYGLGQACDHIEPLLKHVALTQGRTQKVKVLTGTGGCSGRSGVQGWHFGDPGPAPGCADTPVSIAISRERQHDDAQLPSCCLRVPAGLPSRTPGQGDAGLRPVTGQALPAAMWTGDTSAGSYGV